MAECGHCGKYVKGIKEHIKAKHDYTFYMMGPDFKYYGYGAFIGTSLHEPNPAWDKILEEEKLCQKIQKN